MLRVGGRSMMPFDSPLHSAEIGRLSKVGTHVPVGRSRTHPSTVRKEEKVKILLLHS